MALKPYVVIASHAVGLPGGLVGGNGDLFRLEPELAEKHVRAGEIAEAPKKTTASAGASESPEDA